MSSFYCEECDRQRNRKWHGAEDHEGNLICTECFDNLPCDHLWKFCEDTQGDGSDCSFYLCRTCGESSYPENMPKQTNGGF